MSSFAQGTKVPVDRTRLDIEKELVRFKASSFHTGYDPKGAYVIFQVKDRWVKMTLTHPDAEKLSAAKYDSERRRLWRCLYLLIKAKLAAVEDGITTVEEAFLAHTMTANGQSVYERIKDDLAIEYQKGGVQPLMLPRPS